jgi:hypothetical protein
MYMCTQYLHYIHPFTPFPHLFPPPTDTSFPKQDMFCPPILQFCIRK